MKAPLRLKDGVESARDSVGPLLRFLDGVVLGVKLVAANRDAEEREGMLVQLSHDLRFAARVMSALDTSLEAAWTKLENTYAAARAAAHGRRIFKLGKTKKRKPRNAERVADLAAEALSNLDRDTTLAKPRTKRPKYRRRRIERENLNPTLAGISESAEEGRTKATDEVVDALVRLGGGGSLTEILGKTSLSYAQTKKAIARLEGMGWVWRSGNKRSTRYHLTQQ